jgi:hypothetical protein
VRRNGRLTSILRGASLIGAELQPGISKGTSMAASSAQQLRE